jgi:hypothetical protein
MEHDKDIDVSVLEALIELRKQQELVDQYCKRAEELKTKVEEAVYKRVTADYGKRRTALEQEAAPLVTKALGEYRKLRAIYERVQRTHDAARLDKEEVEFRHTLGEIDDAVKTERLKEPERVLAESASEIAALDAQEALFRAALPNVDLAAHVAPPEPTLPAVSAAAVAAAVSGPHLVVPSHDSGDATSVDFTPDLESPDATFVENPAAFEEPRTVKAPSRSGIHAVPKDPSVSGTRRGASGGRGAARGPDVTNVDLVPAPPSGAKSGPELEDRTFIVPEATLTSEADNGKAVNFRLTALTYIGRSEENQLRLNDPGVSRRHVLISATQNGYSLRDLGSQNGTYVNGDRVDEGMLADGDRITIGEVNLIFRSAQSAARHA